MMVRTVLMGSAVERCRDQMVWGFQAGPPSTCRNLNKAVMCSG